MLQSLSDILQLLQKPSTDLPFLQFGDNAKNAFTHLATILKQNLQLKLKAPSAPPVQHTPPPRVEILNKHQNPQVHLRGW